MPGGGYPEVGEQHLPAVEYTRANIGDSDDSVFWEFVPPRNRKLEPELYQRSGQTCFFTVRTVQASSPFGRPAFAQIAVDCLLGQRTKSHCQLDAYCVMPDHLHLLVTPMEDGASSVLYVNRFKGWCGRMMRLAGWTGALWQRRSYDHLLRRDEDLQRIVDYILANPVRKGLSESPESYPWSGIPEPLVLPMTKRR